METGLSLRNVIDFYTPVNRKSSLKTRCNTMALTKLFIASALITAVLAVLQQSVSLDGDALQTCAVLEFQLPGRVSFRGSDGYQSQTESYWATNQGELLSACHVTPRDSTDLQKVMFLIYHTGSSFAIKSGGHSVVANTSNVDDDVVIDLELLNHVTVQADQMIVDVGTGARWKDVYQKLEGMNYGIAGARAGSVGVGGYLLGGGLSPFSGIVGWACDGIALLEVVLANGTILEVDHNNDPDLLMALKGGGSNFGIISRARLELVKTSNKLDVAFIQYQMLDVMHVVRAITEYNHLAAQDPEAAVSVSVGGRFNEPPTISAVLSHRQGVLDSKVLQPFFDVTHYLVRHERLSQLELSQIYDDMNPKGFRQHRTTATIHNDEKSLVGIVQSYVFDLDPKLGNLGEANMRGGLLIQPLTYPHLHHGSLAASNMLGLQKEPSPLLLLSAETRYSNSCSDSFVHQSLTDFMNGAHEYAAENNASHRFRYLNYASADQIPFEHVQQNQELWSEVQAAKQKYDPHNVFGKQMRHPFKVQHLV